jgi:hypothetical protein
MNAKIIKQNTITAFLISVFLLASCSPKNEPAQTKNAYLTIEDTLKDIQGTLKAHRKGQYVTLKWENGPIENNIKQIDIQRNATGTGSRLTVAKLRPNMTEFKDCLPDHYAYWYWVQFITKDNKSHPIGPIRAEPDKAGSSLYIKQNADFRVTITRTDEIATISWDFPEDKYRQIRIFRYLRPRFENVDASANLIITSLEWKSSLKNVLSDANADYWFWFQIILESGTIIYQGPVKAEYTSD